MLVHANGECGELHAESCASLDVQQFDFDSQTDASCDCGAKEPLSSITDGFRVAMGIGAEEHAEGCENRSVTRSADIVECDCAEQTHSTSQCEGCGTYLHGERHAMHLYKDQA
jgi:hypothetical protein